MPDTAAGNVTESGLLARLSELEQRLASVEARDGVLKTLHTLAQTIDYGEHERWLDCFTVDGAFEMVEVSGTTRTTKVRHEGRAALAAMISGHSSAPEHYHKHLTTVPLITTTGADDATAVSYFARIDAGEAGPFLWSFGRYLDRFHRDRDGAWRVRERVLEVESRAVPVKSTDIGRTSN